MIKDENNRQKDFEENRMTIFKGDIPISVNNSIIFDKTFIVEQWIRRIIMFVLMTEYGPGWLKAFNDKDLEEYEKMRRKLTGREIIDHKDDNLLWYASIGFLANFIKKNNIVINKIKEVTDMDAHKISKAVFKIADIRNEMAHNRTITKVMAEDYKSNFDILKDAIIKFKTKTIYSDDYDQIEEAICGFPTDAKYSGFLGHFQKLNKEHFKESGAQSMMLIEDNHYTIVLLPSRALGADYIDTGVLLDKYAKFKDHIVAFYVNKSGNEFQVIVPKKIESGPIYKQIISTFFNTVKSLGTEAPYELQDSKYTCNPKVWFYENVHAYALSDDLW